MYAKGCNTLVSFASEPLRGGGRVVGGFGEQARAQLLRPRLTSTGTSTGRSSNARRWRWSGRWPPARRRRSGAGRRRGKRCRRRPSNGATRPCYRCHTSHTSAYPSRISESPIRTNLDASPSCAPSPRRPPAPSRTSESHVRVFGMYPVSRRWAARVCQAGSPAGRAC